MCGIVGFIHYSTPLADPEATIRTMACQLVHRGPDYQGIWWDSNNYVALGHRRLAIIDRSPRAAQPMASPSGRYVMTYNGEIYNYQALYQTLHGATAQAFNDTATLIEAIETWGVETTLQCVNGMFALSIWDRHARTLYLARDRVGIKPLYYGWHQGNFLFASELKAIRAFPGYRFTIDRHALALQMRHLYIPAPYTVDRDIYKLEPGTYLTLDWDAQTITSHSYWSARTIAEAGEAAPRYKTVEDAKTTLHQLLQDSVKIRMRSDVPIGAFLSGGVDSSTITALMQAQSSQPVNTFTIGFHENAYNEAPYAKAIAQYLGTHHTELYVSQDQAMAVIPELPQMYDEPFADASQIPTFLISQLAKNDVTVILSGDGGDELFAGYNRHTFGRQVFQVMRYLPSFLRPSMGELLKRGTSARWIQYWLKRHSTNHLPEKLYKVSELLKYSQQNEIYRNMLSYWKNPEALILNSEEPRTYLVDESKRPAFKDFTARMMYYDLITYLPDDILTKVDRASMAVSLEARVPVLDHRVIEFAWQCPLSFKLRAGQSKWLLRQVLYDYVPQTLIERPKAGFAMPIAQWLRGPLRDWAEALLDPRILKDQGLFNTDLVRQTWQNLLNDQGAWHDHIWSVLMFQAWYQAWIKAPQTDPVESTPV